jgi:hypothetical protein
MSRGNAGGNSYIEQGNKQAMDRTFNALSLSYGKNFMAKMDKSLTGKWL